MSNVPNPISRPYNGGFADPSDDVTVAPGVDLTIQDLVAVARGDGCGGYARVTLGGDWRQRCQAGADYVERAVRETMRKSPDELAAMAQARIGPSSSVDPQLLAQRALIYGVTTGFGNFKSRPLDSGEAAAQMQKNVLRSHATGVGPPMPTEAVRAMMLLRLRTFVEGYSGLRPAIVEFLLELINRRIHPWVPQQGSVGSSGDLCPLAHLSLALIGEGLAWFDDQAGPAGYGWTGGSSKNRDVWDIRLDRRPAPKPMREVLAAAGLASKVFDRLAPKEGIALTNGTSASTAIAALAVYDASMLYAAANLAASLTLQAMKGSTRAFDPKVHALRRHAGQAHAAQQILSFAAGSELLNRAADVQDAYSLRCAPAVHGAALAAMEHAWLTVEHEINAITDNPLFLDSAAHGPPCDGYAAGLWDVYAAGNFHGEPIGLACDYLGIAVAELANVSERRIQSLLDEHHNRGLPSNLWPDRATAGLNSGLMICQYAAAGLVSENKVLAHPASVDSIPTSSNAEDHVAMATISSRHAAQINENARNVLAVEWLVALQALDIRLLEAADAGKALLSPVARAVRQAVRGPGNGAPTVDFLCGEDRALWPDIAAIQARLASGDLIRVALDGH